MQKNQLGSKDYDIMWFLFGLLIVVRIVSTFNQTNPPNLPLLKKKKKKIKLEICKRMKHHITTSPYSNDMLCF